MMKKQIGLLLVIASMAGLSGCRGGGGENAKLVPAPKSEIAEAFKTPKTKTAEEMEKIRVAETNLRSVQVTHDFLQSVGWTGKSEGLLSKAIENMADGAVVDTRARALQLKAHLLLQKEKRAEAIEVYKEAATLTADPNQRFQVMQNMANLFGLMDQKSDQIAVYNQMMTELEVPGLKMTVANQLISLYISEDRFDEAVELYKKMSATKETSDQPMLLSMLNRLVPTIIRKGKAEDALALIEDFKKGQTTPDTSNPTMQQLYLYEIQLLGRKGEFQKAQDIVLPILASIQNKQAFLAELMKIAEGMAMAGDDKGSVGLLSKIKVLQIDTFSQGKILFAQADVDLSAKRKDNAIKKMRQVQTLFKDDIYKKAGISFYLASRLVEMGDKVAAKKELIGLLNPYNPFTNAARDLLMTMGVNAAAPGTISPTQMTPPAPPGGGKVKKPAGVLPD